MPSPCVGLCNTNPVAGGTTSPSGNSPPNNGSAAGPSPSYPSGGMPSWLTLQNVIIAGALVYLFRKL